MNISLRFKRSFNWRMLLIRVLVNMLALFITALVVPNIYFVNRNLLAWIAMALGLGILNALIKPIIQFLTLRFIFVTAGLVLVLINAIILYLLSWLMPAQFAVDGLLWALVGGLILGIVNSFLENLLGLAPPIVSEKHPEIRQRVKDRQFFLLNPGRSRGQAMSREAPNASAASGLMPTPEPALPEE
jgi:putative membrane protein